MISDIKKRHHKNLLRMNETFVHWLSALDEAGLSYVLERADYARQIADGQGVLIGYAHDVDYPNHKNMAWLSGHLKNFFYIDRIIIDAHAQGKGLGQKLYTDVEKHARARGYDWLACEVNTKPDNPGSHRFHKAFGFKPLGEQDFPTFDKAVRYYAKKL